VINFLSWLINNFLSLFTRNGEQNITTGDSWVGKITEDQNQPRKIE